MRLDYQIGNHPLILLAGSALLLEQVGYATTVKTIKWYVIIKRLKTTGLVHT